MRKPKQPPRKQPHPLVAVVRDLSRRVRDLERRLDDLDGLDVESLPGRVADLEADR